MPSPSKKRRLGHGTTAAADDAAGSQRPSSSSTTSASTSAGTSGSAANASAAPPLQMLPPPMDTSALLALMAQLTQQQPQQPTPVSLPRELFLPLLGSLSDLGLPGFPMPPDPSAFESLLARLAAASAAAPTTTSMQHQPRFDLGAADPTPLSMNSLQSLGCASSNSAFSRPVRAPSDQRNASAAAAAPLQILPSAQLAAAAHALCSNPALMAQQQQQPTPVSLPAPHLFPPLLGSLLQLGLSGFPVPLPPSAFPTAATFESLLATLAAASAATPTTSMQHQPRFDLGAADPTKELLRFLAQAEMRKRDLPPTPAPSLPTPQYSQLRLSGLRTMHTPRVRTLHTPREVDNDFIANMPLDWVGIPARLMPSAGAQVKDVRRQVMEDDDCKVIGDVINRRYKDHTQNVVYNVTTHEHMTDMRNKGILMSRHQAALLRLRYIAEHTIRSLNEFGWAVVDNYLGQDHVGRCAKEMVHLYEKDLFTAGQLMDNSDDEERNEDDIKNVRSDYIYWYDGVDERATKAATIRLLVSMLDATIQHFENRIGRKTIGGRSRAMLAIYPGGSTRYVKHVDNPNMDGRLITCIYYCNANWNLKEHGGALRLFPETSKCAMDINPQADRLVFFWSDRRNPHEVIPVHRHRFAVTIWYMEKAERQAALERKAKRLQAARSVQAEKEINDFIPPNNGA